MNILLWSVKMPATIQRYNPEKPKIFDFASFSSSTTWVSKDNILFWSIPTRKFVIVK
jgi:hypothetical protein